MQSKQQQHQKSKESTDLTVTKTLTYSWAIFHNLTSKRLLSTDICFFLPFAANFMIAQVQFAVEGKMHTHF